MNGLELALSFDDVLLEPAHSRVLPGDAKTHTVLGPLTLQIPVLSAAMDTVTEFETAIALALLGGLGVLHKNLSIDDQAAQIRRVKKFQHGRIQQPLTIRADQSLASVRSLMAESGVTGFPVLDAQGVLVGMCTGRDLRFVDDHSLLVRSVMSSPVHSLPDGATAEQIRNFFKEHKVEKLPLVDSGGRLRALITSRDLRTSASHPQALRDTQGSLMVGAAVGVGETEGLMRSESLVDAGCDVLCLDSAHGHSEGVEKTLIQLRKRFPRVTLIAGNVATADGAKALAGAGADIVKVGMGPGSICTTRIVSGAGVPQFTAIQDCARALQSYSKVGLIADGGIRFSGDLTKALAAGAHAVMLGSLFAGTDESPGETILYGGRAFKLYRGMGSLGAMRKGSRDRYFQSETRDQSKLVPEGVEARVPARGPLRGVVDQLLGGLRSGMGYVGAETLEDLRTKARFRRISNVALRESHVHGVQIVAEAPNYASPLNQEDTKIG